MGALVFKISGRRRRAGCGGFDSHALPHHKSVVNPLNLGQPHAARLTNLRWIKRDGEARAGFGGLAPGSNSGLRVRISR